MRRVTFSIYDHSLCNQTVKVLASLRICDGEERAGCFVCLPGVSWLLCGSSSRYHGFVCSLWLWYYLIILTYYIGIYLRACCYVWLKEQVGIKVLDMQSCHAGIAIKEKQCQSRMFNIIIEHPSFYRAKLKLLDLFFILLHTSVVCV